MKTQTLKPPTVLLALALSLSANGSTQAAAEPDRTMAKAIEVLNEIAVNPRSGPPRSILLKAEGIAIIPDQITGGFVLGAKYGKGVVLVRRPDRSWSDPVFISSFGGSVGLQAGASTTDLVLVFKGRRSVESFLNGKGKMTMGLDVTAAAGPSGLNFEAGTDLAFKAEILSYSRSRGIFAGVSAAGGTLSVDRKANTLYYGVPIDSSEILADGASLQAPPSAAVLQRLLAEQTGVPVVRKARPRIEQAETIDDEPIIEIEGAAPAPRLGSNPAPPPTSRTSVRKRKPTPKDDGVILAAGAQDDEADAPAPRPTGKAKPPAWKKSRSDAPRSRAIEPDRDSKLDPDVE